MPILRDPRNDRRRRVLTQNLAETAQTSSPRSRPQASSDAPGDTQRRGAGYSQDVRRACGQRLVQLIPVRRRSYFALIIVSLAIPALLLTAHHMIYVSGRWAWYGHPLAFALDAGHSRSVAAWFESQLWLLCLAATLLTYQLRRHKLDDYGGEYRLWFWLVLTCLLGSLEASTGISELFALALDRWSQINLGWSGPAVVKSTMAVLVGMLGLRLCTELKTVPLSVMFMLAGLSGWATSAALSQPELQVNLSPQLRHWLRAACWLGGLTAVWLAAVTYLRSVYIEAQQRFLLRGHLAAAANALPLRQRLRQSLPWPRREPSPASSENGVRPAATMPVSGDRGPRRWLPALPWQRTSTDIALDKPARPTTVRARTSEDDVEDSPQARSPGKQSNANVAPQIPRTKESAETKAADGGQHATVRPGLRGFFKRSGTDAAKAKTSVVSAPSREADELRDRAPNKSRRLMRWLRQPKDDGQAEEFRKVRPAPTAETKRDERKESRRETDPTRRSPKQENHEDSRTGSWTGRLPRLRMPRPKLPRIPKPSFRGLTSRIKLPKLPSLRLPPPEDDGYSSVPNNATKNAATKSAGPSAINREARPMPSTEASPHSSRPGTPLGDSSAARSMSKAERKRLRRLQQEQDRAA